MANETIDVAMVTQFSDQVHVAAQQSKARLRPFCKIKQMTGDVFAYDGLGLAEATEILGRHQPVVFSDIEHRRRKISRRRFALVLPVDASDVRGALIAPESEYAMACAKAMERVFDRVVVAALFASVYTGREFGTTVTYANDGGRTVTATAGVTYEKLVEVNQNFIDDEIGNEVPVSKMMAITGDEHTAFMKETELISGDYNRSYVVEKGEIQNACGIQLVKFAGAINTPILTVSGGVRDCFVLAQDGMCVGMSKEMEIKIEDRPDLHETKQVSIVFELGAVRTEGARVMKFTTTD